MSFAQVFLCGDVIYVMNEKSCKAVQPYNTYKIYSLTLTFFKKNYFI